MYSRGGVELLVRRLELPRSRGSGLAYRESCISERPDEMESVGFESEVEPADPVVYSRRFAFNARPSSSSQ